MNIHRYFEPYGPETGSGFLHDINYKVEDNKALVLNIRTSMVENNIVKDLIILDTIPVNEVTAMIAYSILLHDKIIDDMGNYIEY